MTLRPDAVSDLPLLAVTPTDNETLPLFPADVIHVRSAAFGPAQRLGETVLGVDLPRLVTATVRVGALLADGAWHLLEELRQVGGSSGDRRARDLRDRRFGYLPIDVEPDPTRGRGHWRYRLDRSQCSEVQLGVLRQLVELNEPGMLPVPERAE